MEQLKAAILIVSNTVSRDHSLDQTYEILSKVFENEERWDVVEQKIVPDSVIQIQAALMQWTDSVAAINLVVTTGGTGFATQDVTPEAVSPLLHKHASGLVHGMLSTSQAITPFALMARPIAGVRHKTLIITLPGSPKGAKENLMSVIKLLPHACAQAWGANSRDLHHGGVEKLERDAGLKEVKTEGNAPSETGRDGNRNYINSHGHGHDHSHGHGHGHGNSNTQDHVKHAAPRPHTNSEVVLQSNDYSLGPSRRHRSSPFPMLSVSEALEKISSETPDPLPIRTSMDRNILGHVLAANVEAKEAVPAFRASIVDGYAVRIAKGEETNKKGIFSVAFASHAQGGSVPPLAENKIARITTGAPLPAGSDAVVMVEDTLLRSRTLSGHEEKEVEILTNQVKRGENVREIGSDVQVGDVVMEMGEGISAIGGEFGLLGSVGTRQVQVYKKPIVGILSTGDEIVPHDRDGVLNLGEVRDTNRPTLLAAARSRGFETVDLGIASDKPEDLETILRHALSTVDVLITSGGVSMGELDLLKPTIERNLGGTIHFGRVSMKPGKPTTFATVPATHVKSPSSGNRGGSSWHSKPVFSLPGNPASAVVTFMLFVLPALHQMSGIRPAGLPRMNVTLGSTVTCDPVREEYHRAVLAAKNEPSEYGECIWAISTGGQRSSRIGSFKGANALLKLPAGGGTLQKGARIEALLLGPPGGVALM